MIELIFIIMSLAFFFTLSRILPEKGEWRSRTLEIGIPIVLATICILLIRFCPQRGEIWVAIASFTGAALFAVDRFSTSLIVRLFSSGNQEGAFVFLYALTLTFGVAFAVAGALGVNLFVLM